MDGVSTPDAPVTGPAYGDFDTFVRTRSRALLRAARLLTGDEHLAEDLVQSALARTHQAWPRLRDPANAEAYARQVMYRLQISVWRRRRIAERLSGDLPEPVRPARREDTDALSLRLSMHQALARLTPKQRAVLVLRYFEDRSEVDAAQVLGVSVGTVKSQAARALARLRTVAPELSAPRHAGTAG